MSTNWEIGEEARELDQKTISERIKLEKRSNKKIIMSLLIYGFVMTLFYFFL